MAQKKIISFRRNPDNALRPIAVYNRAPVIRDSAGLDTLRAKSRLLHRVFGVGQMDGRFRSLTEEHAPALLRAVELAQNAPNEAAYRAAFAAFDAEASQIMHEVETGKRKSRADAGLYTLLAPVFQMQEVLEQLIVEPMLPNILPRRSLGTPLEQGVYMEYVPGSHAATASWEHTLDDAPVAAGQMTPRVAKLIPYKVGITVSGREKEIHDAMRGQMGAPNWDLFSKRMDEAMREALSRQAQLVSYGDPDADIYGLLSDTTVSGITAANVNFDSGTGLTDANTIIAQVNLQAQAVGYDPRLVADTLVFDAASWYNLTGRGVSNTGDGDDNVIGRVFKFRPEIQEITWALECGPTTAVTTALTPKVGATEAARLRGGYNDSGTTKRCMVILKNDPDVLVHLEGLPISVEALDQRDGADRAIIRGSSGGLRAFRKEAIRICYL